MAMTTRAHAQPAPTADAQDEGARLYEEGAKASKAGQLEKARDLYVRAWRLNQMWQIAMSLGRVEFLLGRYRDAAEHLEFARRAAEPEKREGVLKATQEMVEKARSKVGVLNVTVNPPGAEVLVDGKVVGVAPLAGPVFVEPGMVFVEARREGYAGVRAAQTAKAGIEDLVILTLKPATSPGFGVDVDRNLGGATRKRLIIAGSVVSSVAALTGAGLIVGWQTSHTGQDKLVGDACSRGPNTASCIPYWGQIDAYNGRERRGAALETAAFWALGSAAAVGVVTFAYAFATSASKEGSNKSKPRTNAQITLSGTTITTTVPW
jgi:hypothetical protein